MKILITGNEGFIGRNFERYLTELGHDVSGFDIKSGYDAVDFFRGISPIKFDLLIHAAANVGGRAAIDQAPLWVARNMTIDHAMFEWSIVTQTPVLYFSSSAAYPVHLQEGLQAAPMTEDLIDLNRLYGTPDNTYGWSKLTGEMLARVARSRGATIHIVRPFSGYGTDQTTDYPFGSFLEKALRGAGPFNVWSDGTQIRDWIHVDDIMAACMSIVDAGVVNPVNLATGRGVSFTELAGMFMEAEGHMREIEYTKDAPRGCSTRVGDPTYLNTFYEPKITIEEGISRALKELR